jgi:hypothetical protein
LPAQVMQIVMSSISQNCHSLRVHVNTYAAIRGHPLKGPCQEGKRIRCKKKIFS